MNRLLATLVLAVLCATPFAAHAQEATPTPNPHPMTYEDPGMNFTAPAPFRPLFQRRPIPLAQLPDDATPVAEWVIPDRNRPKQLMIMQEHFDGDADQFYTHFSQQLREQGDEGAIIKNKQSITLKNGMPARYLEMTSGTGFDAKKAYVELWADGSRGVAVLFIAQTSESDEKRAKEIMSDLNAVRYPAEREDSGP